MNTDELKEKIAELYAKYRYGKYWDFLLCLSEGRKFADSIVSILAPELEKAEKMKETLKSVKVWFHFFARDVGTDREEAMVKSATPVIQILEEALIEVKDESR